MKVLVAGCGSIGLRHLDNLARASVGCRLAYDVDPAASARAAERTGAVSVATLEDALADRPDAVMVCTPTFLHLGVATQALAAGAHVFVEKPLAADTDGLADFVRAAAASNRAVLVGCNMRFHPGVACLARALADGLVGRAVLFRSWFKHDLRRWRPGTDYRRTYSASTAQGGGIMLESVHEIDYLEALAGPIAALDASTARVGDLDIDSEDVASMFLRFEGAAAGSIEIDYLRPVKARGCEVVGDRGMLIWTSEGKQPERLRVAHYDSARAEWRELLALDGFDGNAMYERELEHFLACVRGDARPALGAAAAARIVELVIAARDRTAHATAGRPA